MADETHYEGLPVAGYRPQDQASVDWVNRNKEIEERVLRICDFLATIPSVDQRWLAIGRTGIEKSFMAINRAIFKPGRVDLSTHDNWLKGRDDAVKNP